ncbi:MAG: polysaccharide deacetylase [Chloroflexi bacterium]|nr:polysaccharide deacetylase [Chloroflexota bacterium]
MTGIWPGKTQCVVMLGFDLDGVSGLLYRTPEAANHPSVLSRAEFGPKVGVFRILDLLDRYEIPASFFVPGWIAERNEDTVRDIARRGHEVGHHGYMHEPPASLSPEKEAEILDKGIEILEGITGQRPLGYRSPSWDLSEYSLEYLAERGFVYDSSLMAHDAPYFVDTPKGRLVELPVDWALDDAPYYAFNRGAGAMNTPQDVYKAWEWEFDGAYQYGSAFILTMHPQHSGRLAKLVALERLIKYIKGHPNIEFMRCIDVAKAWTEEGMRPS